MKESERTRTFTVEVEDLDREQLDGVLRDTVDHVAGMEVQPAERRFAPGVEDFLIRLTISFATKAGELAFQRLLEKIRAKGGKVTTSEKKKGG